MSEQQTTPATPLEASTQLAALCADSKWNARLLAGEADAKNQFNTLSATAHGTTTDAVLNARPSRSDVDGTNRDNAAADLIAATKAVVEAAKTGAGMTAANAQKRLDAMTTDAKFAERLLANDPAALKEFHEVSAIAVSGDREAQQVADAVVHMERLGITERGSEHEKDIIGLVSGSRTITAEFRRAVEIKHAAMMRDRDFTTKLLSGDPEAGRKLLSAAALLAANVTEAA